MTMRTGLLALVAVAALAMPASAQDIASFYKGKTVNVIIPSNAGGGYNTYSRLVARFMGKHIPGNPTLVPQNMPGSGGLVAANHLYNIAPKDGTVFGMVQHGVFFKPIFAPDEVRYDVSKFNWLGSATAIPNLALVNKQSPVQKVEELFTKEMVVGATGGGTNDYMPKVVNEILGTKMKVIPGYPTSAEILLAIARNEVHGIVGLGLDSLPDAKKAFEPNLLFQLGAVRHPDIKDLPLIQEFAKTPDDKAVLEVAFASISIGRVFIAPPGIPADRLAALQKAFDDVLKDPEFLEAAKREYADIQPISAAEIKKIFDGVYARPKPILDRAAKAMASSGGGG
jgi:tripartite-type tricarboxylate transporter receptor subunit TctC